MNVTVRSLGPRVSRRFATSLLLDSRLPTGGYAYSGGVEAAVRSGTISGIASLGSFLRGRLSTVGFVDAAFSAAAADGLAEIGHLDDEAESRCPSEPLRAAGRAQAKGLLRAARSLLGGRSPGSPQPPPRTWSVALGVVARELGLDADDGAFLAAYAAATGPAWAAVRLLGLDPFALVTLFGELGPAIEQTAFDAARAAQGAKAAKELPARSAPVGDIGAELHARWEVRLFGT